MKEKGIVAIKNVEPKRRILKFGENTILVENIWSGGRHNFGLFTLDCTIASDLKFAVKRFKETENRG